MESEGAVISLADESGVMVKDWAEAGYKCYCVDIQHSIRNDRVEGNVHYVWGDIRSWTPPMKPLIIFAFTPCTHLAVSGARDFAKKGWNMLRDGVDLFHSAMFAAEWARCPYLLENPVGRLSTIYRKPDYTFNPCDFGGYLDPPVDHYTKKTCLWTGGGFVMPEPKPVDPTNGSMMHTLTPGADRAKVRSKTPAGFARAVFEANEPLIRKGRLNITNK